MGYSAYDFFDDHVKTSNSLEELQDKIKYQDPNGARKFCLALLYAFGGDDYVKGMEYLLDELEVSFIVCGDSRDLKMIGSLPDGWELRIKSS